MLPFSGSYAGGAGHRQRAELALFQLADPKTSLIYFIQAAAGADAAREAIEAGILLSAVISQSA